MYGAMTCGQCAACREGRDNLCENVAGIMGFHIDGFARDLINLPARLVVPVPHGVSLRDAACAPIAFGTTEHMLFDNAKLKPGETILVHAGGSGIGSVAIKMAKAHRLHRHHHGRRRCQGGKGQGARRRSRHQLQDRTLRRRRAQADQEKRRRRRVRTCRRRRLQRLAVLLEARRPAGDLRFDRGAHRHHQSDAAVPAAV